MSYSARAKRMERHHKRGRPASLSLVSLMDIFTILVFFLLVNSADVQSLEPPRALKLPESIALEKPRETVIVMVTKEQVLVQGDAVVSVADVEQHEGVVIAPLRRALRTESDRALLRAAATDASAREITILADRDIPYRILKKIMASCTDADYGRLSLAVIQKPEALGADAN
jgi:biopolymer transport protein ExbD